MNKDTDRNEAFSLLHFNPKIKDLITDDRTKQKLMKVMEIVQTNTTQHNRHKETKSRQYYAPCQTSAELD